MWQVEKISNLILGEIREIRKLVESENCQVSVSSPSSPVNVPARLDDLEKAPTKSLTIENVSGKKSKSEIPNGTKSRNREILDSKIEAAVVDLQEGGSLFWCCC